MRRNFTATFFVRLADLCSRSIVKDGFVTSTSGSVHPLLCVFVFAFLIHLDAIAQTTLIVSQVPGNTPVDDTLYLAGTFNEWSPKMKQYSLKKQDDGTYSITLPKQLHYIEYKITRGSWASVEGDLYGHKLADRTLTISKNNPQQVEVQVLSWEDLGVANAWDIYVTDIPSNTPYQAPIFISGNFNNWKENDQNFRLTHLENGNYIIKIAKTTDTLYYKFTRGSWESVECRANGRTLYNRQSIWDKSSASTVVYCEIAAWEDMVSGTNLLYAFILLAACIHGLVIVVALVALRNKDKNKSLIIKCMIAIAVVVLLSRISSYNSALFNYIPKILLVSDFIYFLYAPLSLALVVKLLGRGLPIPYFRYVVLAPVIVQLALYTPLLVLSNQEFTLAIIDKKYDWLFHTMMAAGFFYNGACWVYAFRLVRKEYSISAKKYMEQPSFIFITTVMVHAGVVLLLWGLAVSVDAFSKLSGEDVRMFHEGIVDVLWLVFGFSTFIYGFLLISQPDLLRLPKEEAEEKQRSAHPKENIEALKTTLTSLMKKEKPYLNPKITLQDLSEIMHINVHTLSWLINEGYGKNFFDFVNEYRIEEFKRRVNMEQFKNYTFLAIAMEVGFSSKTTFNRSFKKCTGKTPREFFNVAQESQFIGISE